METPHPLDECPHAVGFPPGRVYLNLVQGAWRFECHGCGLIWWMRAAPMPHDHDNPDWRYNCQECHRIERLEQPLP